MSMFFVKKNINFIKDKETQKFLFISTIFLILPIYWQNQQEESPHPLVELKGYLLFMSPRWGLFCVMYCTRGSRPGL